MKNLLPKAPLFVSISSRKCGRLKNMLPKSPLSVGIAISKLGKLKICSQNPHCFPLLTILSHFGGLLRKIPKLNICSRNPHCSKVRNTSEGGFAPLQKSAPKIPTVPKHINYTLDFTPLFSYMLGWRFAPPLKIAIFYYCHILEFYFVLLKSQFIAANDYFT